MNTIEAIRNEIKRLEEIHERNLKKPMERGRIGFAHGVVECCDRILSFIDSLPEEPAPKGYDEAYLNECIAKASKTWEGVDVDKYMDEVRGNLPKSSDSLEEAAEKYEEEHTYQRYDGGGLTPEYNATLAEAFLAGAEWQKEQMMDEWLKDRDGCFWDGVEEGKQAMKEQMMKEAVEGTVHNFSSNKPHPTVLVDAKGFNQGDKVRIIIVKEDEQ